MSVLIKGMEMPTSCENCELAKHFDGYNENDCPFNAFSFYDCPLVALPDHGDLVDMDEFSRAMYHEAFEVDSALQKWESGCWIRYKMFERLRDSAPVVIPAERSKDA